MDDAHHAVLKSTGERVLILGKGRPEGASGDDQWFLCKLPPQAPGHKPRREWIRSSQLEFSRKS